MRFDCTRIYFWYYFFLVLDNPEITHLSVIDSNEIVENNTAILQCKVESNPLSKMEWTFENKTLNVGNHGVLQSNYTIQRAKCVDTGFYMCTATNIINMKSYSDKRVVQLSVRCKYIILTFFSSIKHNRQIYYTPCTWYLLYRGTYLKYFHECEVVRYCVSSNQIISAQTSTSQI